MTHITFNLCEICHPRARFDASLNCTKALFIWYRDVPVYRGLGLLIIHCYFCSCVYMETGTSRCTGVPVEATKIPVKRDKLCPYKRNIPVHRDEVKWNLKRRLTRENLQKRKQKETTFVGMLFMRTRLVFVLLTSCYQLFHDFFNEIDTSRSPGTSWSPWTSRSPGTSRCTDII